MSDWFDSIKVLSLIAPSGGLLPFRAGIENTGNKLPNSSGCISSNSAEDGSYEVGDAGRVPESQNPSGSLHTVL